MIPNAGCLKGIQQMTVIVWLRSGRVEVYEQIKYIDFQEHRVRLQRHVFSGDDEEVWLHKGDVVKMELLP